MGQRKELLEELDENKYNVVNFEFSVYTYMPDCNNSWTSFFENKKMQ